MWTKLEDKTDIHYKATGKFNRKWIHPARESDYWRVFVNKIKKFSCYIKYKKTFLTEKQKLSPQE